MNEYQKAVYDEYAETYDEGLKDLLGGRIVGDTKKFAEYKVQLLKALCKPRRNEKILDFGCGTGRSLSYLDKYFSGNGIELFGCDVSRESLKIAKRIVPSATLFLNTPIEELYGFDVTFDIVMCACVLHHIAPEERRQWIDTIINEKPNPPAMLGRME